MDLFSTYIQVDKNENLADSILIPCKKILSELPHDNGYKYGKTSYKAKTMEKYEKSFEPLYNFILLNAHRYCDYIKLKKDNLKINILNLWISEMYKYGSHGQHGHPGSQLSGTFYVHVEPNSADIVLCRHETLNDPLGHYEYSEYDKYNSDEWAIPAEKGNILIWKSDLPHFVGTNESNSRIAISFNLGITQ
jgi:uncharacterized protein (TIGR02466 family)